jgi:hypothetical protein
VSQKSCLRGVVEAVVIVALVVVFLVAAVTVLASQMAACMGDAMTDSGQCALKGEAGVLTGGDQSLTIVVDH